MLFLLRTIYVCKITSYHMANKSPCQLVSRQLVYLLKKLFFLFLPSHPHKCDSNALFIGVSVVRVSVRANDLPSHPMKKSYCSVVRSVSLRLQSLNQKTLTDYHWCTRSLLHGSVFWFLFDLSFDFHLIWIVPWQDKGDFRRILVWG